MNNFNCLFITIIFLLGGAYEKVTIININLSLIIAACFLISCSNNDTWERGYI